MRNWNEIKIVYIKEITEILRNKRVIISAFLIPLLIYPVVIGGMDWLQSLDRKKDAEEGFMIALPPGHQDMARFLEEKIDVPIHILEIRDPVPVVVSKDADLGLEIEISEADRNIWFYYLGSNDKSIKALEKCKNLFENNRVFWIREFLASDVEDSSLRSYSAFESEFRDVANLQEKSGHKIAKILPFILIMMLVGGCSFAAVDLIAGEKERGCFETLLVSPISRESVIVGKMLVVIITGFISLAINLLSMYLCLKLGLFNPSGDAEFTFTISNGSIAGIFLCSIPMTIIFASVLMLISAKAKTYQAGQTLLMPFSLLALLPAVTAALPGMQSDSFLVAIPIANVVVAMKEMLEGSMKWWSMIAGNLVNLGIAVAILRVTVGSLEKEGSLIPGSVSDTDFSIRAIQRDPVVTSLAGFAFIWLMMFFVMAPLQAQDMVSGLIITLWGLFLTSAIFIVRFQKLPLKSTMQLRSTSWLVWTGAAIFQLGMLPLTVQIAELTKKVLPMPPQWLESFSESLTPDISTFATVLLIAVSPGICEELLFRGAILGSLRNRWSPWRAIIVSSMLFGLLHFSVYRLLPTTLIGIGLGWIAYMGGSIYPAMMAHALNNAIAVTVVPELNLEKYSENWLWLSFPLLLTGIWLIRRGARSFHYK